MTVFVEAFAGGLCGGIAGVVSCLLLGKRMLRQLGQRGGLASMMVRTGPQGAASTNVQSVPIGTQQ